MSNGIAASANAPERTLARSRRRIQWARILPVAARVVTGLVFFVFGLNGFLDFLPHPSTPPPPGAMAFAGALMGTGYMLPLIKGIEVLVGLLLLTNRFVALALVLLAPLLVNIVAFHAFLAPSGLVLALVLAALALYLAWTVRDAYRPLLSARSTFTAPSPHK